MRVKLVKAFVIFTYLFSSTISGKGAYASYKKVTDLSTWEQTIAKMESISIRAKERSKGYCPLVNATYQFSDQTHSSKLELEDYPFNNIRLMTEKFLAPFSVDQELEVFVNPSAPNELRLATYSLGWTFYLLVLTTIMLATVLFIMVTSPARSKEI